jgi:hypothetical protein
MFFLSAKLFLTIVEKSSTLCYSCITVWFLIEKSPPIMAGFAGL